MKGGKWKKEGDEEEEEDDREERPIGEVAARTQGMVEDNAGGSGGRGRIG